MGATPRFEPTPQHRTLIEEKIGPAIDGLASEEARRACHAVRALPLFIDWTACLAIRPDGQVIWIDYEPPHEVRPVEDEREKNIGLFQGSLRHPDLGFLAPTRPADAITCPDCRGTGRTSLPKDHGPLAARVVCSCGGTGWLPAPSENQRDRRRAGRRKLICTLMMVLAIPPALLTLSLFGIFPRSGLNSWRYDIDINSGRTRYARCLFWIELTSTVEDSALTSALSPEDWSGRAADWHPVTTLSPKQHYSPHYYFHGAIFQIHELESCSATGKLDQGLRREMARRVLHLWQESGNNHRAGDYIEAAWQKAAEFEKQGRAMGLNDLPEPR